MSFHVALTWWGALSPGTCATKLKLCADNVLNVRSKPQVHVLVPARRSGGPQMVPQVLAPAGLFLLGWGAAAALGWRPVGALVACALFAPGLGFVLFRPLGAWAETRSSRQLATYIEPGAPVICFETFRESLPFYLGRPVVLLSDNARALASNYVKHLRLGASDDLVPEGSLGVLLDHGSRPYVLASRWNVGRLTRMSPRPLVPVQSDRRSILFRPRG